MLNEFEQGHNTVEATKNICCVKGKVTVGHSTVQEILLRCKNLDDQERSERSKIMDFDTMLQAREANLGSST